MFYKKKNYARKIKKNMGICIEYAANLLLP